MASSTANQAPTFDSEFDTLDVSGRGQWSMDTSVQNAGIFADLHNVAWNFHSYGGGANGNKNTTVLANTINYGNLSQSSIQFI